MTDEEITALVERLEGDPDEHSWQTYADAASAIRQLMRERDEALVRVESLEDAWRYDRHRD